MWLSILRIQRDGTAAARRKSKNWNETVMNIPALKINNLHICINYQCAMMNISDTFVVAVHDASWGG